MTNTGVAIDITSECCKKHHHLVQRCKPVALIVIERLQGTDRQTATTTAAVHGDRHVFMIHGDVAWSCLAPVYEYVRYIEGGERNAVGVVFFKSSS